MKFLSDIRLLLIGSWLGAACFFIAVAQVSFSVQSREMAGAVVNRTLAIVNYSGLGVAIILLLTSLITAVGMNKILLWTERTLLLIFAAACAVGQFVIAWWMLLIRTQIGKPMDEAAADDPLRIQFNNLHDYSQWLLAAAMIAAFLAFFVIANRRQAVPKKSGVGDFDFQKQFKI